MLVISWFALCMQIDINCCFVLDFKLAVLGACTCSTSGGQPCPCAKMAAVTRKQLLHLKQEVTLLGLDTNKRSGASAQNQIKPKTL